MKIPDHPHGDASVRLSGTFKQAVALGIEAVVRHHLRNGQDVNSRDEKGQTPLIIAAAKGHAKLCSMLLKAGANPTLKDSSGSTALDVAVTHRRAQVWDLLQGLSTEEPLSPSTPASPVPVLVSTPVPEFTPVVLMTLDEEDGSLDLSGWQPEVDPPPPLQDPLVLPDVRSTQRELGEHVPIDLDEDWSDVEIALPDLVAKRRRRRDNEEEARWLGDASALVLIALRDGEVPESFIGSITPAMGVDGDYEGVVDYDAMLRTTLGDLGVRVENDEDARITFDGPDDEDEERYGFEVSEATQFLRTCLGRREEPLIHYLNALSNIKLLSKEDEQAIGRAMEEGMSTALTAIVASSIARDVILEALGQVERREINWSRVIADDPAYIQTGASPDDDRSEMPEEYGPDEVVDDVSLPAPLANRLASVRDGYAALRASEPQHVAVLTQELGNRIQALGLREDFIEHLRKVLEGEEVDETIRERLFIGLEKTRKARHRLFHCNQKLVFWIARKYRNRGLALMDLVQEGSLGLMKATAKFDYSRGYKFSTYALWWIRQSITRAIADQSRLIRVPVHMLELVNKVRRAKQEYEIRQGREPTPPELAANLAITEAKAAKALVLLDEIASMDELDVSGDGLADLLVDPAPLPEECILQKYRDTLVARELAGISNRERLVICRRFGIGGEREHTLEEVGQLYGVTRERIRQIEAGALRKLRHPSRSKRLQWLL